MVRIAMMETILMKTDALIYVMSTPAGHVVVEQRLYLIHVKKLAEMDTTIILYHVKMETY